MSLDVYPYRRLADGSLDILDDDRISTIAGGESTREWLWSSPVVRSLGATYLPRLKEENLFVPPEETLAFQQECAMLLAHLPEIAAATQHPSKDVEQRGYYIESNLMAILIATHRARFEPGDYGVLIW
jgi:hypothetical protein